MIILVWTTSPNRLDHAWKTFCWALKAMTTCISTYKLNIIKFGGRSSATSNKHFYCFFFTRPFSEIPIVLRIVGNQRTSSKISPFTNYVKIQMRKIICRYLVWFSWENFLRKNGLNLSLFPSYQKLSSLLSTSLIYILFAINMLLVTAGPAGRLHNLA